MCRESEVFQQEKWSSRHSWQMVWTAAGANQGWI